MTKMKSDVCLCAYELGKELVRLLDYTLEAVNAVEFLQIFYTTLPTYI